MYTKLLHNIIKIKLVFYIINYNFTSLDSSCCRYEHNNLLFTYSFK